MELRYKAETVINAIDNEVIRLRELLKEEVEIVIRKCIDAVHTHLTYWERLKFWWNQAIEIDIAWSNELRKNLLEKGIFECYNKEFRREQYTFYTYEYRGQMICSIHKINAIHDKIKDILKTREILSKVDNKEITLTQSEVEYYRI